MYLIAKLLMNSLYGRFGMDYELETHKMATAEEIQKLIKDKRFQLSAPLNFDGEISLVSYIDNKKSLTYQLWRVEKLQTSSGVHINVSIPIASAPRTCLACEAGYSPARV